MLICPDLEFQSSDATPETGWELAEVNDAVKDKVAQLGTDVTLRIDHLTSMALDSMSWMIDVL